MAKNTYKRTPRAKDNEATENQVHQEVKGKDKGKDKAKTSDKTVMPTNYIPYLIYVAIFGIFYVSNAHNAEKMIRKINHLEKEVENLRSDYTSLEVDYISAGVQSEITEKAKQLGLIENDKKVRKIIIKNSNE